jgi:hypothetical protein
MNKFKIQSDYGMDTEGEPLYWANDLGWTDLYNGTEFLAVELPNINLPIGTKYIRWANNKGEYPWNKNYVQKPVQALRYAKKLLKSFGK